MYNIVLGIPDFMWKRIAVGLGIVTFFQLSAKDYLKNYGPVDAVNAFVYSQTRQQFI